MKKTTATLLAAFVLLTAFAVSAEKFITIRFSEEKMNYHWGNLNGIRQIVGSSNIPHQQAVYILQSIDSLQKDIQSVARLDSIATTPLTPKK